MAKTGGTLAHGENPMKLTLRELFLLVALVAMACGWWADRYRVSSQLDHMARDAREAEKQATEREIELLLQLEKEVGRKTAFIDSNFAYRYHSRMDDIANRLKTLRDKQASLATP
jgi:hypothetical protein